jgi:hypothetical protein
MRLPTSVGTWSITPAGAAAGPRHAQQAGRRPVRTSSAQHTANSPPKGHNHSYLFLKHTQQTMRRAAGHAPPHASPPHVCTATHTAAPVPNVHCHTHGSTCTQCFSALARQAPHLRWLALLLLPALVATASASPAPSCGSRSPCAAACTRPAAAAAWRSAHALWRATCPA